MQKKLAESVYGIYENLADNIQNSFDEIGQSNMGFLVTFGKAATFLAKNLDIVAASLNPLLATWGAYAIAVKLGGTFTSRTAISTALLQKAEMSLKASMDRTNRAAHLHAALMQKARAANDRYSLALLKASAANNVFARSLYKIQAALIANPLIAVFTGTAAILAGSITLWNKYKETLSSSAESNKRVAKSVEEIQKPLQDANKNYERIIKKIKEEADNGEL